MNRRGGAPEEEEESMLAFAKVVSVVTATAKDIRNLNAKKNPKVFSSEFLFFNKG